MSKTVTVTTTPDPTSRKNVRIDTVLAVDTGRGYHKRFGLGFVPEGQEGRKVFEGPMVPGPWAYTFGLASVMDNSGGTGAERKRNQENGIEHDVEEGDLVEIDGLAFTVKITKHGSDRYIALV